MKELTIAAFEDGSKFTITYTGKEAELAFFRHIRPAVDRVHRDILEAIGICCQELQAILGDHSRYPMLVQINTSDWTHPAHTFRYPGASGPGFYRVFDVDDPDVEKGERVTYIPLAHCFFCGCNLEVE